MKYILLFIGMILAISKAQGQGFTNTDSLRTYNIKYITNNAATAFTNLRLHTLLRGIIDWVDTARAGTGGGGALGIDTLYALNDSTIRYRRNGVFRNTILRGVYDTRRKVDTAYALNDSTLQIKINGTNRNIILPGRHWTLQGILNNGSTLTENENIILADSLQFTSGWVIIDSLRLRSLQTKTDTTANKPIVVDAAGNVHKMAGWPGVGTPAGADRELQINNSGVFGAVTGVKVTTQKTLYADSLNTFRINIRGDSTFSSKIVFNPSKTKPGSSTAMIGYGEANNDQDADTTVNNTLEGRIGSVDGTGTYIRWGMEKRWMPFPGAGYYQFESHPIEVKTLSDLVVRPISYTMKEAGGDDGSMLFKAGQHFFDNWDGNKSIAKFALGGSYIYGDNLGGSSSINFAIRDTGVGNRNLAGLNFTGQISGGTDLNVVTYYGEQININTPAGLVHQSTVPGLESSGRNYVFSIAAANTGRQFWVGKAWGTSFDQAFEVQNNGNTLFTPVNISDEGSKVQIQGTGDNALYLNSVNATTNTVVYPISIDHNLSSGSAANGFGAGLKFKSVNGAGTSKITATIESPYTDVTNTDEDADIVFKTIRAGTLTEAGRFKSSGDFEINSTGYFKPAIGTTAQRPTGAAGYFRYNSTLSIVEWYNGTTWVQPTTGGITSINAQTGPAIIIQGGTGTSATTGSNTVTIEVVPSSAALPHTLDAKYTTASNTGTSETDLYTYTVPANRLGIDGRTVNFEIDGEVNDNTATAQIKLYFAGNVIMNTGAINISTAATSWRMKGYIIRTSSTTAHCIIELNAPGLATTYFQNYANLTSIDFTAGNIFKVTAQAGGAGGGNDDITTHSWQVTYKPQPQ